MKEASPKKGVMKRQICIVLVARMFAVLLTVICLPQGASSQSGGSAALTTPQARPVLRKIGYFIEWGVYVRDYHPLDIPAEKVTHINYAFANIGSNLRIQIGDAYAAIDKYYPGDTWDQPYRGAYNQLNNVLREQHPHIKTFISVGGWTWSGRLSDVALTAQSRATFAGSCVDFIRTYNFDGVDIDWEYPVCCGLPSNTYRPEDKQNYTLLMEELRVQLDVAAATDGREYLLTIASAAGYDKMANYELLRIAAPLDWINVMTFDFRGAWDLSLTAHHTPLYPNPADPGPTDIATRYNTDWSMTEWAAAGVPRRKLVLSIPFYGRAWGGVPSAGGGLFQPGTHVPTGTWDDWASGDTGVNDFWEIQSFAGSTQYTRHWDPSSQSPYLYSTQAENGHFISYDDAQSVSLKMDYIKQQGFGGAMFWEFSGDRNETLIDVIDQSLDL